MPKLEIDGQEITVEDGLNLIQAAERLGIEIPHYCYNPGLSISGNCRMCLVEIDKMPKLQIACNTKATEGMVVKTTSPKTKVAQAAVLEFILVNHPIDCPICDQAGECRLQEFSVEFGTGESRFVEEKVKKPKRVDIGPRIVLDDERCIMCSRCVRFMQEIAHDDVLGFVNRGSHTTLTVYPGKKLDSNYSLNTVDICPVGALTSKDFRFSMRVWFLRETKSIDVNCGQGTNILIGSRENVIYRITPRDNDFVNSCCCGPAHGSAECDRDDRLGPHDQ
jgi:NADH-quinone oxidoreductase subunit G